MDVNQRPIAGQKAIGPVFVRLLSMPLHVACNSTVSFSLLFHDLRAKDGLLDHRFQPAKHRGETEALRGQMICLSF